VVDWEDPEELETFEVEPKAVLDELEEDVSDEELVAEVLDAATASEDASARWTTTPPVRSVTASRAPTVACRALLRAVGRGITRSSRRDLLGTGHLSPRGCAHPVADLGRSSGDAVQAL
jgi:hypothetical protein